MAVFKLTDQDRMALEEMPNLCARFKNGNVIAPDNTFVSVSETVSAVNGFFKYLIPRLLTPHPQNSSTASEWFADPTQQEKLYPVQLDLSDMKVLQDALTAADELMVQYPEETDALSIVYHDKIRVLFSEKEPIDNLNAADIMAVGSVGVTNVIVLTCEQLQNLLDKAYKRGIERHLSDLKNGIIAE